MAIRSNHYAELSEFAYQLPPPDARGDRVARIDGIDYRVVKHADRPSGYQGVIFRRQDSGEIVVAHRGTEFTRQPLQDVLSADGGMIVRRVNRQADDALELTRDAIRIAQSDSATPATHAAVTVTGHSLGGCLAQIVAARLNLNGETFNAYGAAGLDLRIPEGGRQLVNHVMAADMVSSASRHFGEVRVYARERDIGVLKAAGYDNDERWLFDHRAPLLGAAAGLPSHSLHHFRDVDGGGRRDGSVLDDPHSRQRAQRYEAMIDKFRTDVWDLREGMSLGASMMRGVNGVADEFGRRIPESVRSPFEQAHGAVSEPRDPGPGLHEAIRSGVERLYVQQGRSFDASAERVVASLHHNAKLSGLERIDHVIADASGQVVFAVQGDPRDPGHRRAQVSADAVAIAPTRFQSSFDPSDSHPSPVSLQEPLQETARATTARSV
ncbi:MAG: XVIPCD domain-containing protein [Lysobacter sp.]